MAQDRAQAPSKATQIIIQALQTLRDQGDRGLTMRQVARDLGMSLSNVQYYFKDKNTLLAAMVDHYTEACSDELERSARELSALDLDRRRRELLMGGLRHGHRMTEMCATFRALWAVAAHDDAIASAITAYYRRYATALAEALAPPGASPAVLERVALLVVPYLEGYSITGAAFSDSPDRAAELLLACLDTVT